MGEDDVVPFVCSYVSYIDNMLDVENEDFAPFPITKSIQVSHAQLCSIFGEPSRAHKHTHTHTECAFDGRTVHYFGS